MNFTQPQSSPTRRWSPFRTDPACTKDLSTLIVSNQTLSRKETGPFARSRPLDEQFFDDALLDQVRRNSLERVAGKATEAIEPLRKAYVFADRMLGVQHSETLRARAIWEEARDKAALAKLRFREGARVKVLAGPHAGKSGIVERLLLNHLHAYVIQPHEGEAFQAADDQVQAIAG